jgi:hypothetical protein
MPASLPATAGLGGWTGVATIVPDRSLPRQSPWLRYWRVMAVVVVAAGPISG